MSYLTIELYQLPASDGVSFYSTVTDTIRNLVYDTPTNSFLPIANVTNSQIPFIEDSPGYWTWIKDVSGWADSYYKAQSFETNSGAKAAEDKDFYVQNGDLRVTVALTQVAIDHNTGGIDALRYVDQSGAPVSGATIIVYDIPPTGSPSALGTTTTDINGRWVSSVLVDASASYTIQFSLTGQYGPDTVTITL